MNQLHWLQIHNPLALLFIFVIIFCSPSLLFAFFFSVGALLKKDSPVEFVDHFLNRRPSLHGLGMCIVLLTIRQPCITKISTTGWNSKSVSSAASPSGRFSRIQPWETQ